MNICDDDIHKDAEYFRTYLFGQLEVEIQKRAIFELKVDEVQLVLEPKLERREVVCSYYFVNPRTRTLFWLDEWQDDGIFDSCEGALSDPHKGELRAAGHAGFTK